MTMRFSPFRLVAILLLAAGVLIVTGCDQSGSNGSNGTTYTASLSALNGSGVSGDAEVTVKNDRFMVSVDAEGTTADKIHAQHIHGFSDKASSCPDMSADSDGDGSISVSEGAPAYGGIRVPLDGSLFEAGENGGLGDLTKPISDGDGAYMYEEAVLKQNLALNGGGSFSDLTLENHAIVVHGKMVNGDYNAKRPVACGTLSN